MPANFRGRYTEWPSNNRKGGSRFSTIKVYRQDILQEAWRRVKSNKGAAGVDEVDIDEIREYGEERFLGEIEQALRNGSYRVSMVRRVHIPKIRTAGEDSAFGHPQR